MFFLIVMVAWAISIAISFANGNRRLPTFGLVFGAAIIADNFTGIIGLGSIGLAALAIITAVIFLANKWEELR